MDTKNDKTTPEPSPLEQPPPVSPPPTTFSVEPDPTYSSPPSNSATPTPPVWSTWGCFNKSDYNPSNKVCTQQCIPKARDECKANAEVKQGYKFTNQFHTFPSHPPASPPHYPPVSNPYAPPAPHGYTQSHGYPHHTNYPSPHGYHARPTSFTTPSFSNSTPTFSGHTGNNKHAQHIIAPSPLKGHPEGSQYLPDGQHGPVTRLFATVLSQALGAFFTQGSHASANFFRDMDNWHPYSGRRKYQQNFGPGIQPPGPKGPNGK